MKRRRITPRAAGGAVEASLSITSESYNNDHTNAIVDGLPRIPGVPIEHVPSFVHVLRVASKFFQKERNKQPFTIVDWERLNSRSMNEGSKYIDTWNSEDGIMVNENVHKTVHDSIMNRMDKLSNNLGPTSTASSNGGDSLKKFFDAVNVWMDGVHVHARRQKRLQTKDESLATTASASASASATTLNLGNQQPSGNQDVSQPIPYSIFLYLWELQQQHKRVTVRRSALFLSGLLLLKSKDCRSHINQGAHLVEWVSNIGVKIDGTSSALLDNGHNSSKPSSRTNSHRNIIQLSLLQNEAITLMTHLVDKGFGRMYVKLAVALKSLRHRCIPNVLDTSDFSIPTTTLPGMANWRRLRDFALLHGRDEIRKVRKLLDRADECLEILVPRIEGVRHPSHSASWEKQSVSGKRQGQELLHNKTDLNHHCDSSNINSNEDSSESDESDIDWEDGDEIEKNDSKSAARTQNLHLSAVEKTMAAMEKTVGNTLFSGGRLEIDFNRRVDEGCVNIGDNSISSNARRNLEKIVQKLSNRYLVRLSAWLDGLRNSDNLVWSESSSLVSLPPANDKLRLELIDSLSALKQDASTAIASASRLSIWVNETMNDAQAHSAQRNMRSRSRNGLLQLEGVPVVATGAEFSNRRIGRKNNKRKFQRIKINYKK